MKKLVLMLALLAFSMLLGASASLESVNMENHGMAVTRVVLQLNGSSETEISRSGSNLDVLIKDYLPGKASVNFKAGGIVSDVEQHNNSVLITVAKPFRYEQLRLGNRLAVDVFTAAPSKAERITIAEFYGSTGKLNSADKMFNDLHIDYREDGEILYKWAQLLYRRGSARATEKLSLIPHNSAYFAKGQQLMAEIHGDEEPPPPPPEENTEPLAKAVTAKPDSVPEAVPQPTQSDATPSPIPKRNGFAFPFVPFLIILAALLLVFILFFSLFTRKKSPTPKKVVPQLKPSETALDSKTMCRIVSKLTADGWTRREIARELKIPQKDVEQYLQLCHQGGHEDYEV